MTSYSAMAELKIGRTRSVTTSARVSAQWHGHTQRDDVGLAADRYVRSLLQGRVERDEAVSLLGVAFAGIMSQNWVWKDRPTAFNDTVRRAAGN